MNCRSLRLKLVRGLAVALWIPALSVAAAHAQQSTTTTLTAGALNGCAQTLVIAVTANGQPVTGVVAIEDEFNGQQVQLDSIALSSAGTASPTVSLVAGDHSLTAVLAASSSDQSSTSSAVAVSIPSACTFMAAVSNFAPATTPVNTLTPGQSGTATVSIIPSAAYTATLTSPMFVSLSCSGLSDQATCAFTPNNVEISPGQDAAVTSSMVIQTYAASRAAAAPVHPQKGSGGSTPIAWAMLLPGALGLGGFAWGMRRRRWLSRLSLLALVGLVTVLGTTACNPRYNYQNHAPVPNPATPAGTYAVTVYAVSSNGVSATTNTTTFALTVQ
jgi:hypothetical protein